MDVAVSNKAAFAHNNCVVGMACARANSCPVISENNPASSSTSHLSQA